MFSGPSHPHHDTHNIIVTIHLFRKRARNNNEYAYNKKYFQLQLCSLSFSVRYLQLLLFISFYKYVNFSLVRCTQAHGCCYNISNDRHAEQYTDALFNDTFITHNCDTNHCTHLLRINTIKYNIGVV